MQCLRVLNPWDEDRKAGGKESSFESDIVITKLELVRRRARVTVKKWKAGK